MTYFGIIKSALDKLIAGICKHRGVKRKVALQMARQHLQNMSEQWRSGQSPTIAYGDPLCRFAYLYCHTAVNANICESFIRDHEDTVQYMIGKMNEAEELKICAFGGGPGTEFLALTKLLKQRYQDGLLTSYSDIDFTLLDNTPEWAESWDTIEAAIRAEFANDYGKRRNWPFTISKSFQPFDMTRVEQFSNLVQLFVHDIYILNYVVSEIIADDEALANLVNTMAHHAPSGARFVFIDRNQDNVSERVSKFITGARLTELWKDESATNMDSDEQANELEEYIEKIEWKPRVQWNGAFCIIAQKS